jgi:hypothetical protein
MKPGTLPPTLVYKSGLSAVVGMLIGVVVSLVVNCTLVEISLSAFFSLYFGILFFVVGSVILWRVGGLSGNPFNFTDDSTARNNQLVIFACLIIFSGLLCFLLEKNWFVGVGPLLKVPLYTILGVSVSFALTFSLVDLCNYVAGFMQVSVAKPLVESNEQVYLILVVSLIMGGIFGLIFGAMDVEDEVSFQIRLALRREEGYCYPIGVVLGAVAGACNEYLRHKGTLSSNPEFDTDI